MNTVSMNTGNNYVLKQLETFIFELVKTPMKEVSISQAIFSTTRPRSIILLLLGLAVATDNRLASKWINILTWVLVEFSLFFLHDLRCLFHIATLPWPGYHRQQIESGFLKFESYVEHYCSNICNVPIWEHL